MEIHIGPDELDDVRDEQGELSNSCHQPSSVENQATVPFSWRSKLNPSKGLSWLCRATPASSMTRG